MRILFIVNPSANSGKAQKNIDTIDRRMREAKVEYEMRTAENSAMATRLAKENARAFDIVCAVGGDGTIRDVAEGLVAAKTGCLGIIPAGTGNDIAKGFGWSKDIEAAIDRLLANRQRAIDVGWANDHVFINIASIGFDAAVVAAADQIKKVFSSKLSYYLGLVKAFFTYRNLPATISDGGHAVDRNLLLIAVANGRFYGGGFEICPDALWDDGLFDVCIVHDLSKPRFLRFFPSILSGTHMKYTENVDMAKKKGIDVQVKHDFILNLDGELIPQPAGTKVNFRLEEGTLSIVN